jgi:imidazole glycerol-phosphate synthase subunit HisF
MIKRRIIPIELLAGGRLVKTRQFGNPRDVGHPVKSSQVYSDQDADELVLLNIDRDNRSVRELIGWVEKIAEYCFVPLAVGGGVSHISHAEDLFRAGADKVVVNTGAYDDPQLIGQMSGQFGSQSVVISIDVERQGGQVQLKKACGRQNIDISIREHLCRSVEAGAGEVLINSIDRDGMMVGYDLALLQEAIDTVDVPIIICGGAGQFLHLKDALELGADGVACGSLFNFGDNNPLRAKAFLKNYDIPLKRI